MQLTPTPKLEASKAARRASDASGMSVEDAVTSAYDDQDRARNGIAEGERGNLGKYLKGHADAAGTTVINGLNSLIEPAVALRHGDMTAKREVIGRLVDEYGVHPLPEAEPVPEAVEYGQPSLGEAGQTITTKQEAVAEIEQFALANPIMRDERIQDHMNFIAHDMRRQGFQPTLEVVFGHAVNADPRYSAHARQVQEADHLATGERGRGPSVGRGPFGAIEPRYFRRS